MADEATSPPKKQPPQPMFIYDTRGEWHATKIGRYLWDTRGDYVGFVMGENHDVYTASGEWIGNLIPDGRIVRKRAEARRPLLPKIPARPPKPKYLPARSPLPPMCRDLGFTLIDVLEWEPEIFKRVSDQIQDMD